MSPPAPAGSRALTLTTAALALSFTLTASAQTHTLWPPDFQRESPQLTHSLTGKIWSVSERKFVSPEELVESIPKGSWVLLGENHVNPDHHLTETALIEWLAARKELGNVAFEMADTSQQPALDVYLGADPTEITTEVLSWKEGWSWEAYGPSVISALTTAKRVIGADIPREAQMAAYRSAGNFPAPNRDYETHMLDLLFDSHCGHLPKSQLGNMLAVQIARDQGMASNLRANTEPLINLMITGTVHARNDIGIPLADPEISTTSLLMVPLDRSENPADYLPDNVGERAATDYLLFTPERPAEDMCDQIPKREG